MDGKDALALIARKKKGQKQKNKGRKVGRNFRWGIGPDGKSAIDHSQTKYRSEGRRARNKARRAAQRARIVARKTALANQQVTVI
jgi:hypothetical protein